MTPFWRGFLVGGVAGLIMGALLAYAVIGIWIVPLLRRMTEDIRRLLDRPTGS